MVSSSTPLKPKRKLSGFSLLEVLVAMSILTVMLVTMFQSFSTSLLTLSSVSNLWKSMVYTQNELLKWERSKSAPLSINQGTFGKDHPLEGFRWERKISDVSPLAGIIVRKVSYSLKWDEGKNEYSYHAEIYIKPN